MIIAFINLALAVCGSVCLYAFTPLISHFYWFWVPIVLVPVFWALLVGIEIGLTGLVQVFTDKNKEQPKPNKFVKFIVNQLSFCLITLANGSIHVTGAEKVPSDTRCMFVSNHTSNFDPIVLFAVFSKRDLVCISKPEIWNIPIGGALAHRYGFIKINRTDAREAIKSINKAADNIKNNISDIIIYPEGTRSKTYEMIEFHHGSFKIATKAECPLVICSLQNPYMLAKNFPFIHTKIYLDILEVMSPEEMKNMTSSEIAKHAQDLIQANLDAHIDRKRLPRKMK